MKLQLGLTGRYQGRGVWRRIFGSGPVRVTPIDVKIEARDEQELQAAAAALNRLLAAQPPSRHRVGSFFDLTEARVFIVVRPE